MGKMRVTFNDEEGTPKTLEQKELTAERWYTDEDGDLCFATEDGEDGTLLRVVCFGADGPILRGKDCGDYLPFRGKATIVIEEA